MSFWPFNRNANKDKAKADPSKPSLTARVGDEVKDHVVDFFSAKKKPDPDPKAPPPSWRNTTVTALSFLVFTYAFIIQIWIISQSVRASASGDSAPVNGNGSYTSEYPIVSTTSISRLNTKITRDWTSYTSWTTTRGGSTFVTTGRPKSTSTGQVTGSLGVWTTVGPDGEPIVTTTSSAKAEKTGGKKGKASSTTSTAACDPDYDECPENPEDENLVPWARSLRDAYATPTAMPSIKPTPAPPLPRHTLNARALTETRPGRNVSATCLFYNGSELPKHGALALGLNIIYNVWICVFIILLLSYERKRLRFKRNAHSAAVIGGIQIWMGTDYFSRGVELQLQFCAAAIYVIALLNLIYGLPATNRRGESLFPYLLRRDDDIATLTRSNVIRQGAAKPQEGQLFVRPADAAEEAGVTALPEKNLKPSEAEESAREQIDIFGTTGKTRPDGTKEDGKPMDAGVKNYVLGGVGASGNRWYQRDPQEMMWSLLMPPAGGDGGSGGGGGGGGGSSMERMITAMLAMQLMGSMPGAGGGMGGNMRGGPMMGNPYNPMGQRYPGMMPTAPGGMGAGIPGLGGASQEDTELNKYLARAAERRAERAMYGI